MEKTYLVIFRYATRFPVVGGSLVGGMRIENHKNNYLQHQYMEDYKLKIESAKEISKNVSLMTAEGDTYVCVLGSQEHSEIFLIQEKDTVPEIGKNMSGIVLGRIDYVDIIFPVYGEHINLKPGSILPKEVTQITDKVYLSKEDRRRESVIIN